MDTSRIPSIFKNVKREPKRFRYSPRHFDPQQEEQEKRKARIREEMGMGNEPGRSEVSIDFKGSWSKNRRRRKAVNSNMRLLLISEDLNDISSV